MNVARAGTARANTNGCSSRPRRSCSTRAGPRRSASITPHWEAADGSRIVGATKERADAPTGGSIPWLLLAAKSDGPEGSFSKVTSVQRLHTVGGVAPRGGCFQAEAGTQLRIGYTADYYFFAPSRPAPTASRDFDIGFGY